MQRSRMARWRLLLGATAGALTLGISSTLGIAAAGATVPVAHPAAAPRVPSNGAYLGIDAHFDPSKSPIEQLTTFQSSVGRDMAIVSLYMGFTDSLPLTTMNDIAAQGSVPMISWHCSGPDSSVASGADDPTITAQAQALKAYGHPVLLRWFWEMNLPAANAANAACLGPAPTAAAYYAAAFRHIVTIFREVGATNVSFIWAPSAAYHAPPSWMYYPGSSYVDWIGFDLYDRANRPQGFAATFAPTYAYYASFGKPMAITETGAEGGTAGPGGGSPTQQQWLDSIASTLPASFPDVHAFVYVDAVDLSNYELVGSGLSEFSTMGASQYFAEMG